MLPEQLPVNECLAEVVSWLERSRPVILQAPPGAGKTTGVPPALLRSQLAANGGILVLQPRRIAARAAAARLSELAGEAVGGTFGYQVRFDRKIGADTKVISMTTGILLRRLVDDPFLENIGTVVLDEFHERSLDLDLVLGMLQRIRTTLRPELRLVVMSATLDTEEVERLIPDAVTVKSAGRAFEVDVRYDSDLAPPKLTPAAIAEKAADAVRHAWHESSGNVLVFLPGVGEINRTVAKLSSFEQDPAIDLFKLYGDLSPAEQDRVLAPSSRRKLVLATNVAETSVTIDGVTCVIDTGLARVMTFDAGVGIPCLELQPISLASAVQRAGRAGRTAPGVCYRLWPKAMERGRPDQTAPEITRTDLSGAILSLAVWGERDLAEFPWVTPPGEHAVEAGRRLLRRLSALTASGEVTELGRAMNRMPLHPRLSRMLIASSRWGCLEEGAVIAALLSERDPFEREHSPSGRGPQRSTSNGSEDVLGRVQRLQSFWNGDRDDGIRPAAAKQIKRVSQRLQRMLKDELSNAPASTDGDLNDRVGKAMLAAFPDRLAKRRTRESPLAVMVGGRGVKLSRSFGQREADLFLCINVQGSGEHSDVRMALEVDPTWLSEELLEDRTECFFRQSQQAVVARRRTVWEDLVLEEVPVECPRDEHTAQLLFEQVRGQVEEVLPHKDADLNGLIARWRFLQERGLAEQLPGEVEEVLTDLLRQFCARSVSVKELSRASWYDHLRGNFSYEQWRWFEDHAPESFLVPSGNRIRLKYQPGKPPVLAVRIQEIYGWSETPRVAGGTVAVQLHLLGPNHRPQQITEDLPSFWDSTYTAIRKELKRRYSKHHWPEDPRKAQATRNGLKPRGE